MSTVEIIGDINYQIAKFCFSNGTPLLQVAYVESMTAITQSIVFSGKAEHPIRATDDFDSWYMRFLCDRGVTIRLEAPK